MNLSTSNLSRTSAVSMVPATRMSEGGESMITSNYQAGLVRGQVKWPEQGNGDFCLCVHACVSENKAIRPIRGTR